MKKLPILVFALIFLLALAACGAKDPTLGSPVFETEHITRVTFYGIAHGSGETEVPVEHLAEITAWLGTFVAGEKAGDILPPGADNLFVRLEYADGTKIEHSLSTTVVDGTTYLIHYDKEPACYFALFEDGGPTA